METAALTCLGLGLGAADVFSSFFRGGGVGGNQNQDDAFHMV